MLLAEELLKELALRWKHEARPTLRVIGSTALMLRTNYVRGTKDSDVLETAELDAVTKAQLLEIAGPESLLAKQWKLYLEIVPNGLPFLPHAPIWHPLVLVPPSTTLTFEVLDVVDVVVSKLKRFHSNDRSDIGAMIERDLVPHDALLRRFESAVDVFSGDARADELPRYVRNLNEVERDMLGVEETEIDLPEWIG